MAADSKALEGREQLLDLAVKFLSNPKIIDKPKEAKIAFLKKKGLTDDEIERAVKEADKVTMATTMSTPPRPEQSLPPIKATYSWRQIVAGTAVIGGIVGLVMYWIKKFIESWRLSLTIQEQRLSSLEGVVQQIQDTSMGELRQSTDAIKTLLEQQQTQLTNIARNRTASVVTEQSFKTIQADISSLKGLLLNRHQFPSIQRSPITGTTGTVMSTGSTVATTGIPDWQLPQSETSTTRSTTTSLPVVETGYSQSPSAVKQDDMSTVTLSTDVPSVSNSHSTAHYTDDDD